MEAVAKYDFEATADDELSFKRNSILKVLYKENENWYPAELDGHSGLIPRNYIEMNPHNWYYGRITRVDPEQLLNNKQEGDFVVRLCESGNSGDFVLSVKCGDEVNHFKVLRDEEDKFFLWIVKFNSLNELVEYYHSASVSRLEEIKLREMTQFFVKAIYDFTPEEDDELGFQRGDVITVTDTETDRYWWTGEKVNRRGLIPATYVTPCCAL